MLKGQAMLNQETLVRLETGAFFPLEIKKAFTRQTRRLSDYP